MRVFIAALLPEDIRLSIKNYVDDIKPHWEGVKWEDYEKFHITLKFFGDMDESRLNDIKQIAEEWVRGVSPFKMSISGFGAFPNLKKPRVLFIELSRNEDFLIFQRGLDEKLENVGFVKEKRTFKSHITIGRIKRNSRCRDSLPKPDMSSFSISELAIMRSIPQKTGSVYTPLSVYKLSN